MSKVAIKIDWVPNNFSAAPMDENIACIATGNTLEEVEKNIIEALKSHIKAMLEDGEEVPAEFLGEWEPEFHLTTRAQLKGQSTYPR